MNLSPSGLPRILSFTGYTTDTEIQETWCLHSIEFDLPRRFLLVKLGKKRLDYMDLFIRCMNAFTIRSKTVLNSSAFCSYYQNSTWLPSTSLEDFQWLSKKCLTLPCKPFTISPIKNTIMLPLKFWDLGRKYFQTHFKATYYAKILAVNLTFSRSRITLWAELKLHGRKEEDKKKKNEPSLLWFGTLC